MRSRFKTISLIILLFLILLTIALAVAVVRSNSLARTVAGDSVGSLSSPGLLEQLPEEWVDILVKVEDPSFFEHNGIDLMTPGQGWTTITQGLVKRHFEGPLSGVWGKCRQSFFALALDSRLSKHQQLELFLATASFGSNRDHEVVGFENASLSIFGKPLLELDRREYIALVAMLVGPNHFHPIHSSSAHRQRVARIEALLAGRCAPSSWSDVYLADCK